jgi:predicted DsbA family dithiol-disulfide isomerase
MENNITKIEIKAFLDTFCDECYDMPFHRLELIMDDHKAIRYENKEYFVPENNSFMDARDYEIQEYLFRVHPY